MALQPQELENMTFRTVRRGLDPAEVRAYLHSVAATVRRDDRFSDTANQPSAEVARNDAKAILLAAQETAESIRSEARRQADQIRREATLQADQHRLDSANAARSSNSKNAAAVSAQASSDAERRLQNKVRQLEALRAEVERLHVESGKAVRLASDERRAAERVRAESIDEIARLRKELNTLQTQAGSAGVTNSGMRVQIPGAVDPGTPRVDTAGISVVDASVPAPASPLIDAVKSAVGRAIKH